ncbi:MAG: DMT family transporter [Pseudomonadota bacterium]
MPASLKVALLSLLGGGALLGLSTNFAKLAGEAGLPALAFLAWSLAGATAILLGAALWRRDLPPLTARTTEYILIAAFVTSAAPNLIFFSAVPHVGASFVALAITLPPLLTWLGALALRMERFDTVRLAGVLAALAGAGVLAVSKLRAPDGSVFWVSLTLVGPVLLAVGNLYRSARWPDGVSGEALAAGMLVAATAMLFLAGMIPGFSLRVPADAGIWPFALIVLQALAFAGQFQLIFVLQRTGGPVLLSLLGAIGAVVGVPVAVLLLGEAPPGGLALGASLVALGVALVTVGGLRQRQRQDP